MENQGSVPGGKPSSVEIRNRCSEAIGARRQALICGNKESVLLFCGKKESARRQALICENKEPVLGGKLSFVEIRNRSAEASPHLWK